MEGQCAFPIKVRLELILGDDVRIKDGTPVILRPYSVTSHEGRCSCQTIKSRCCIPVAFLKGSWDHMRLKALAEYPVEGAKCTMELFLKSKKRF
jgi:hypothetical protein